MEPLPWRIQLWNGVLIIDVTINTQMMSTTIHIVTSTNHRTEWKIYVAWTQDDDSFSDDRRDAVTTATATNGIISPTATNCVGCVCRYYSAVVDGWWAGYVHLHPQR